MIIFSRKTYVYCPRKKLRQHYNWYSLSNLGWLHQDGSQKHDKVYIQSEQQIHTIADPDL
jgi:hypothetical protein